MTQRPHLPAPRDPLTNAKIMCKDLKRGHKDGHSEKATLKSLMDIGSNEGAERAQVKVTCAPRLLDLHMAAQYLSVSEWTIRDLQHAGILPRVRIPLPNQGELRKLLFDRVDLDRAIEVWKAT